MDIVHQSVIVYRNQRFIKYQGFNAVEKEVIETEIIPISQALTEKLFALLERAEINGEFCRDFIVEVCDGSAWKMKLRHSDKTVTLVEGTVKYLSHGRKIEDIINEAIIQAESFCRPWIFGCCDEFEDN